MSLTPLCQPCCADLDRSSLRLLDQLATGSSGDRTSGGESYERRRDDRHDQLVEASEAAMIELVPVVGTRAACGRGSVADHLVQGRRFAGSIVTRSITRGGVPYPFG